MAVNPITNRIYVANNGSDAVSVIDGSTNAVVATVPVDGPLHLAVNPTTNRVYVANDINDTVAVMEDLVSAPAIPLLPRTGGLPIEVVGPIGLALVTLGIIARRLGVARGGVAIGFCVLLASIGTSVAGAAPPHRDANAVADAPVKRIALTFDDGYNSRNVNLLLDILDREHVSATFFPVESG